MSNMFRKICQKPGIWYTFDIKQKGVPIVA